MLSDEERKAIENLKIEYEKLMKEDNILFPLYKSDAKRLIDIIEKQSKEIEELTSALLDSTPNDKIKEILGIEEDIDNEKLLSLLQTIVDENARLEEIEDRKVQIEYNNVFNKGVKSVEDKIKSKIDYLLKHYDSENFINFEMFIKILQSLLEKE